VVPGYGHPLAAERDQSGGLFRVAYFGVV